MGYTFQFGEVLRYWPLLAEGALNTLQLSLVGMSIGLVVGIGGAVARNSRRFTALRAVAGGYVELVRNTPLLVQLFLFFFALPSLGLRLSPTQAAMLALIFNNGAYATEIVRAGIESIHKSQIEAAAALGLSRLQTFRYIVIGQALERVYPALTGQFIILMLATSITSAIGAEELTAFGSRIQSENFRSLEVYFVCAAVYLGLTFLLRGGFTALALAAFPRRRRLGRWS
jgi:polar amino acid transport system permease protein